MDRLIIIVMIGNRKHRLFFMQPGLQKVVVARLAMSFHDIIANHVNVGRFKMS